MLHGATIRLGERSMSFWREKEIWVVNGYINKYEQPTLYKGPDVNIAITALKTGERQKMLQKHFDMH